ncbi:hypothetical protein CRENBAI_008457 [Crenichthys baileyi]|uniref:Uncharacterized protein n=1 Tax=Crenichthys baileyi TaxID=28760 RepID=A0AAV9RF75_9TELE
MILPTTDPADKRKADALDRWVEHQKEEAMRNLPTDLEVLPSPLLLEQMEREAAQHQRVREGCSVPPPQLRCSPPASVPAARPSSSSRLRNHRRAGVNSRSAGEEVVSLPDDLRTAASKPASSSTIALSARLATASLTLHSLSLPGLTLHSLSLPGLTHHCLSLPGLTHNSQTQGLTQGLTHNSQTQGLTQGLTHTGPDTQQPDTRPDTPQPDSRPDTPQPDSKSASTSSTRRRGRRKRGASAPGLIIVGLCDASAPAHITGGPCDASAPAHATGGLCDASAPAHATEGLCVASASAHATEGLATPRLLLSSPRVSAMPQLTPLRVRPTL